MRGIKKNSIAICSTFVQQIEYIAWTNSTVLLSPCFKRLITGHGQPYPWHRQNWLLKAYIVNVDI